MKRQPSRTGPLTSGAARGRRPVIACRHARVLARAVAGLAVGSFLNVVIARLPRGRVARLTAARAARTADSRSGRTTTSRSSPGCCCAGAAATAATPISARYPLVEALTARAVRARRGRQGRRRGRCWLGLALVVMLVPIDVHRPRPPDHPERDRRAPAPSSRWSILGLDRPRRPARAPDRRRARPAGSSCSPRSPTRAGWAWATSSSRRVLGLYLGSAVAPALLGGCSRARSSAWGSSPARAWPRAARPRCRSGRSWPSAASCGLLRRRRHRGLVPRHLPARRTRARSGLNGVVTSTCGGRSGLKGADEWPMHGDCEGAVPPERPTFSLPTHGKDKPLVRSSGSTSSRAISPPPRRRVERPRRVERAAVDAAGARRRARRRGRRTSRRWPRRSKTFFRENKLRKRVRLGVANQRIVVRTIELPPLRPDPELDAAVRFQAQDNIPMPLDQAVLDYQSLGAGGDRPGRAPARRPRRRPPRHDRAARIAAARGAGLRPEGVDLSAFAMIRALGPRPSSPRARAARHALRQRRRPDQPRHRQRLRLPLHPRRRRRRGLDGLRELAERRGLTLEHARPVAAPRRPRRLRSTRSTGDPEIVSDARSVLADGVRPHRRRGPQLARLLLLPGRRGRRRARRRHRPRRRHARLRRAARRAASGIPVEAGVVAEARPGALHGIDPPTAWLAGRPPSPRWRHEGRQPHPGRPAPRRRRSPRAAARPRTSSSASSACSSSRWPPTC